MADKGQVIKEFKDRMGRVEALPDEPHFATLDETIVRYLKCHDWKLKEAEKALLNTIEYRRQTRPLRIDCKWCHDRPGFHSMRQVGHDESGRPVIYANFAQASNHRNTVDDIITHVTYVIENAKTTMEVGVSTWVFVIDCTGMSLSACNPKLGYGIASVLSNHYPERLGLVICVNHNPVFHGVWKALKKVISPSTSSKVRLLRSPAKMQQVFSTFFSDELSSWLMEEIELNKQKPLPKSQLEFWADPTQSSSLPSFIASFKSRAHDPRGCSSYVRKHVQPFLQAKSSAKDSRKPSSSSSAASSSSSKGAVGAAGSPKTPSLSAGAVAARHKPHPNVVDSVFGVVHAAPVNPPEQRDCTDDDIAIPDEDANGVGGKSDDDDDDDDEETDDEDSDDSIENTKHGASKPK